MGSKDTPQIQYKTAWLVEESHSRKHVTDTLFLVNEQLELRGSQIVELGSGIGTNLQVFMPDNDITGIEGMPEAVRESIRRGVHTLEADLDTSTIPLPSNYANLVLIIDVLEHLLNPQRCLNEAHRIIKKNEYLLVNVPNHFDWRGRIQILRGSGIDSQKYFPESPHWAYPHIRFFSRSSIEQLLNLSGFLVIEDFAPRYLSFPKAHIWRKLGLNKYMLRIQQRWPNLFTGWFFLLCKRI
jgi:SAM-dependent methyltransferase